MSSILFKALPTQARLWYLFNYHSDGYLIWKVARQGVRVGDVAGNIRDDGYTHVRVDGDLHLLHRLIYHFFKDDLDERTQIDHKDKTKSNNRIENLRKATRSQNGRNRGGVQSNNKLGIKGVIWRDNNKKYVAQISINNKKHHLGLFSNKFDAYECYKNKCLETDTEFYDDKDNMRPEVFLEYQEYLLQKQSNIFQLAA